MPIIPADARDMLTMCLVGYKMHANRAPSATGPTQAAFAIGRNFQVRGLAAPVLCRMWSDPVLGDFWYVRLEKGPAFLMQAWPHPQDPGRYLVTGTVEQYAAR